MITINYDVQKFWIKESSIIETWASLLVQQALILFLLLASYISRMPHCQLHTYIHCGQLRDQITEDTWYLDSVYFVIFAT